MSADEASRIARAVQRMKHSKRVLQIALPTAAALGAGAAVAVGSIPGGDGTITGCYAGTTGATLFPPNASDGITEPPGALRVIDPSLPHTISNPFGAAPAANLAAVCDSQQETQITWNQKGPEGPAGPAGPAGGSGAPGGQGAPGTPLIGGTTFGVNGPGITFLKLDGIAGPATAKDHKGEIPIGGFSVSAQGSAVPANGSGAGAGKVSIQSFSITKTLDKSSP